MRGMIPPEGPGPVVGWRGCLFNFQVNTLESLYLGAPRFLHFMFADIASTITALTAPYLHDTPFSRKSIRSPARLCLNLRAGCNG